MIERGADVNDCCNGLGTPLHTACAYGRLECTNILLAAGADTTIKDHDGKVPIEYAEMYGNKQVARAVKEKRVQQMAQLNAVKRRPRR